MPTRWWTEKIRQRPLAACILIHQPKKASRILHGIAYLFKLKGVRPLPLPLPCSVRPCPSCRLLRYCIDDAAPLLFAFCFLRTHSIGLAGFEAEVMFWARASNKNSPTTGEAVLETYLKAWLDTAWPFTKGTVAFPGVDQEWSNWSTLRPNPCIYPRIAKDSVTTVWMRVTSSGLIPA